MADVFGSLFSGFGSGGVIGGAIVRLRLDERDYDKQLSASEKRLQTFGKVATAGVALAGVAIGAFIVKAVTAASDLTESLNKAEVVFGDAAGSVVKFSETTASALGISQAAALSAAAGFGAMAQSAGLSEQASAELSIDLVKLAGDMASFNNQDPTEMLERLRSGLAGEAEPLRQFGVFISEARVQTEAYAAGIAQAGAELTDAQKIQARFNIIMADTAKQQGDFARTVGESLPNQIRVLKAEFTDLAAEVGENFIPVATQLVAVLSDLMPLIGLVADNLDLLIVTFGTLAAFKGIPLLLKGIGEGLVFLGAAAQGAGMKGLGLALGNIGIGAAGAATAIGGLAVPVAAAAGAFALATKITNDHSQSINEVAEAYDRGRITADEYLNTLQAQSGRGGGLGVWTIQQNGLADAVGRTIPEMQQAAAMAEAYAEAAAEAGAASDIAAEKAENFAGLTNKALKELRETSEESITSMVSDLEGFEAGWSLTSRSAVRSMEAMAKQAKQMARDFAALDEETVPEKLKAFLLEQGPAAVHAFVNGTEREKARFIRAWRGYEAATRNAVNNMKGVASAGGIAIGELLAQGVARGITTNSELISVAAAQAVHNAIEAAKREAQAESPSRKMMVLGYDMMRGLRDGINAGGEMTAKAAEKAAEEMIARFEERLSKLTDRLSAVRGRAGEFRGTIAGGFESFFDIGSILSVEGEGGAERPPTPSEIEAFFAQQVAGAEQFAQVLKALERQGANKALLSAIASQGPGAIGFAQSLLQSGPAGIAGVNEAFATIAGLQQQTAGQLTERFFGDKIDELKGEIRDLNNSLRHLRIVVELDGKEIAAKVKQEFLVGAGRNGGSTGLT